MPNTARRGRIVPRVEQLESRVVLSASTVVDQNFDSLTLGTLPSGWSQWSSGATPVFSVNSTKPLSGTKGLGSATVASGTTARTYLNTYFSPDVTVSSAVYLDSLVPAQVLARGTKLNTTTPNYYAVSITRGLEVNLIKMVNGVATTLKTLRSPSYFSGQWVRVTLSAIGNELKVQVQRTDNNQFLTSLGTWQSASANALTATDTSLPNSGQAGLARQASYSNAVAFDDFRVGVESLVQPFDTATVGQLPSGWKQWSNVGGTPFQVSTTKPLSGARGLTSGSTTTWAASRTWATAPRLADVQVNASLYLNSISPGGVLVRGSNLETTRPSYYALRVIRGLELELVRVVNGVSTTISTLKSASHISNQWVRLTLFANGNNIRGMVFQPNTIKYLNADGQWRNERSWAFNLTDNGLSGLGYAGLERPARYAGSLYWDDFSIFPANGDSQPPKVVLSAPASGSTLSGVTQVKATVTDNVGVGKIEVYLDGILQTVANSSTVDWEFDTSIATNGSHTLLVQGFDLEGNVGKATVTFNVQNDTSVARPNIPRHYSHIRIAQLAYNGTPFGALEDELLRDSIDLVVSSTTNLSRINQSAPNSARMLYSNVSNIYEDRVTDWLSFADARGLDRESAFYHAANAMPFTGDSASSKPVNWFWSVERDGGSWKNFTSEARGTVAGAVEFGAVGSSMYLGYPDRFREINVHLLRGASGGWSSVLEYATAVDANGKPTAWAALPLLSDGTAGLTRSGQVLFDPPSNWKPASVDGSARLYFVRYRTTANGTTPQADGILGRDYVNARGTTSGVIPAFDSSADLNRDGYLNDAEYARRTTGKDARFVSESRMFHGVYGQMRYTTNPATTGYRDWISDYHARLLQAQPLATGLFMDNSAGTLPFTSGTTVENTASYANDFGAALNAVARKIAPKWVLVNTAGGNTSAEPTIRRVQGYFEEFLIRPMFHNYNQFENLANTVANRMSMRSPAPYAVLDSHPMGGSSTDPRTQMATLAYYYLIQDPISTFLNFYGGYEPSTSWSRHWVDAVSYDVGQPVGTWSQFASGTDPANSALKYRVYRREYTNALVLYKPLSAAPNVKGTLNDNTATVHTLNGSYRVLQPNGTLGSVVTSVSLRNGEGAILIKV
jgi:hypothetical protein